jgi:tetratricopeptide (TPR) repeat protein
VADNPRIEELRRRVEKDPASIAFAQLAEEYRRAGNYEEAVATCRAGLAIHPSYLSARVTLGRSLIEVHSLEEAETELKQVLLHAPENLAAIRSLAEIHHRRGELDEALTFYKSAMGIARHDPDLEQVVDEISRAVARDQPPASDGMSLQQAKDEFAEFLDSFAQPAPEAAPEPQAVPEPQAIPESQPVPEPQAAPEPQPEPVAHLQLVPPLEKVPEVAQPALASKAEIATKRDVVLEPQLEVSKPQLEIESQIVPEAVKLESALEFAARSKFEPGSTFEPGPELVAEPDLAAVSVLQSPGNPALPGLERFLVAIHSYRRRRAV